MGIRWELFVTPGLGDNSYVLFSDEEAVVIDPQRDAWRFLDFTDRNKLRVRYILETHVHNDYVSGAMEVYAATGARIAAPAKGKYTFDHLQMVEGHELRIGTARIVCLETPGHTFDHVSWLVYEEGEESPLALFSGGSLLVGGAGRTDLLGPEFTHELTHNQYRSIQRYRSFPASLVVLPTHGSGSFCASTGDRKERFTTIGEEQNQHNSIILTSETQFMETQFKDLPVVPSYYAHMAPINRRGATVLKSLPTVSELDAAGVDDPEVWVVDMRGRKAFAEAHIPGSINIELEENFGTYAGWIVPFGARLILITDPQHSREQLTEAVTQLIRIGYENIAGYRKGDMEEWFKAGRTVKSYPTGTIQDLCADYRDGLLRLVDVRQKSEWDQAHASQSIHAFVGDLPDQMPRLSNERWSIACVSGYRSAIAASILDAKGLSVRLIASGGIPDFLAQCPDAKA